MSSLRRWFAVFGSIVLLATVLSSSAVAQSEDRGRSGETPAADRLDEIAPGVGLGGGFSNEDVLPGPILGRDVDLKDPVATQGRPAVPGNAVSAEQAARLFDRAELPDPTVQLPYEPAVRPKERGQGFAVVEGAGRSNAGGSPISVLAREGSFGQSLVQLRFSNEEAELNGQVSRLGAAFAFEIAAARGSERGRSGEAPGRVTAQNAVFDEEAEVLDDLELEVDLSQLDVKTEAVDRVALYWVSDCDESGCATVELLPTSVDLDAGTARARMGREVAAEASRKSAEARDRAGQPGDVSVLGVTAQNTGTSGGFIVTGTTANGTDGTYGTQAVRSVPTYSIGQQSGSVQTAYEFEYAPVAAGPTPSIALTYSSSIADGANGGTNNNMNHVGFGWNLAVGGSISRTVEACDASGLAGHVCLPDPRGTGRNSLEDNFTISLNGTSSRLIYKSSHSGQGDPYIEYVVESNPSWRVFRMTNRVDLNQHDVEGTTWVVSTPDGSRYEFGGDHFAGNSGSFQTQNAVMYAWAANSPVTTGDCVTEAGDTLCPIATRWMLNRIVDLSGNASQFIYTQDLNWYQPPGWTTRMEYTRDIRLVRLDLGGVEATNTSISAYYATGGNVRVHFAWPTRPTSQVPVDLGCHVTDGICTLRSPAYFNTHIVAGIFPEVKTRTGSWIPSHDYVFTQNAEPSTDLTVLEEIHRRDLNPNGRTTQLQVTYDYTMALNNRADNAGSNSVYVPRIDKIVNEFGGEITFEYGHTTNGEWNDPGCQVSNGFWLTNTCDFYPGLFGGNDPVLADDWVAWYRWPVTKVTETDTVAGAPPSITTYTYPAANSTDYGPNDGLYAHNGLTECHGAAWTQWNQFRGYPWTEVTTPLGSTTKTWFYRGMEGDKFDDSSSSPGCTLRSSNVDNPSIVDTTDHEWLAGQAHRSETRDSNGTIIGTSFNDLAWSYIAGDDTAESYFVWTKRAETHRPAVFTGARAVTSRLEYDEYGQGRAIVNEILDWGDLATGNDQTWTRHTFTFRDPNPWNNDFIYVIKNTETRVINAPANPVVNDSTTFNNLAAAGDYLSHTETQFDGITHLPTQTRMRQTSSNWLDWTTFGYDTRGRVTSTTANGVTSGTSYHATTGEPITTTLSTSGQPTRTTEMDFELRFGLPTRIEDPNGIEATYTYDDIGRTLTASGTGLPNPAVKYEYSVTHNNSTSNVVTRNSIENGNANAGGDHVVVQFLDGFGRVVQTQAPSAEFAGDRVISFVEYGPNGEPERASDAVKFGGAPGSNVQTAQFPTSTRTRVENGGWRTVVEQWVGTSAGSNPVSTTTIENSGGSTKTTTVADGQTRVVWSHTDAPGRVRESIDADGNSTIYDYQYDTNLNQAWASINPPGHGTADLITTWTNIAGQAVKSVDPSLGTRTSSYDATTGLLSSMSGGGTTISYQYDDWNRVVAQNHNGSAVGAWVYGNVAGSYDRLMSSTATNTAPGQVNVTTAFTYDTNGRVQSEQWTIGTETFDVDYGYFGNGSINTVTYPTDGGGREVVTYDYDNTSNRPISLTGDTVEATVTYTPDGMLNIVDGGNGTLRSDHTHDARGRLEAISTTASSVTVMNLTLAWDNRSNLTSRTRDGQLECFHYDVRNQLEKAYTTSSSTCNETGKAAGSNGYDHTYTYSESGNLTQIQGTNVPGGAGTLGYGAGSATVHQVTSSPGRSYTYDTRGNQITRTINGQTTNVTFDALDRMIAMDAPNAINDAVFSYTADGVRAHRVIGDTTTYYVPGLFEKSVTDGGSGGTGSTTTTTQPTTTTTQPSSNPSSLKVNFGYNLSGWDTDMGADYTAAAGYGWTDTQPAQCFQRNGSTTKENTLCRAESRWSGSSWTYATATWEADLAPGDYTVTIGWGDTALNTLNTVTANGQAIVNGWNVNQNLANTGTVTVGSNGKLELTFGPNVNTKTAINYIEANPAVGGSSFLEPTPFIPPGQEASGPPATADEAADLIDADGNGDDADPTLVIDPVFSAQSGTGSLKVNFGATVSGWDTDLGANYNASTGYGWTQSQASQCFARNGSTQITDTLCRAENRWYGGWPGGSWSYAPASWEADLPAGTYDVTIGWGDSAVNHTNVIAANGVSFANGANNYQNLSATHVVTVGNDGKLNLTFGSQFTYTAINYIEATSTGGGGGTTTTTTQPTTTTTTPSGQSVSYTKHYPLAGYQVATEVDGVVHYHAAGHLGSTTLSTHQGQSGQVVDTALYFPYGAPRAGSPTGTERGYTGQIDDPNTGLMFYNARYYDPITSRFTQADSVLDGTNRYRYVHNSPLTLIDPTGEESVRYCPPGDAGCESEGKSREILGNMAEDCLLWGNNCDVYNKTVDDMVTATQVNHGVVAFVAEVTAGAIAASLCGAGVLASPVSGGTTAVVGCGAAAAVVGGVAGNAASGNSLTDGLVVDALVGGATGGAGQYLYRLGAAGRASAAVDDIAGDLVGGTHPLSSINPSEGLSNCANCAVALDATLGGSPASALSGGVRTLDEVARAVGQSFAAWGNRRTFSSITREILEAGSGARGIVYGARENGQAVGHYFNVMNQNGTVRYLDGQSGKVLVDLPSYDWVALLRTD